MRLEKRTPQPLDKLGAGSDDPAWRKWLISRIKGERIKIRIMIKIKGKGGKARSPAVVRLLDMSRGMTKTDHSYLWLNRRPTN